jgi:uncharacterized protein
MTIGTILILLVAGFAGGLANAMAGGATLITFPAMMAAGLAPIPANASNAVAVVFGNIVGAWTERRMMPAFSASLIAALVLAVAGGVAGAVLLLVTPERIFVLIVPLLIGLATLVFGVSKWIQRLVAGRFGYAAGGLRAALVLPATVYGGYFGAGLGVILMAVISSTSSWDLRRANVIKNLLASLSNVGAIIIFVVQGVVSWPETAIMLVACIAGGFAGGKALGFVSAATMRKIIITIGFAMTVFYAWKYWL